MNPEDYSDFSEDPYDLFMRMVPDSPDDSMEQLNYDVAEFYKSHPREKDNKDSDDLLINDLDQETIRKCLRGKYSTQKLSEKNIQPQKNESIYPSDLQIKDESKQSNTNQSEECIQEDIRGYKDNIDQIIIDLDQQTIQKCLRGKNSIQKSSISSEKNIFSQNHENVRKSKNSQQQFNMNRSEEKDDGVFLNNRPCFKDVSNKVIELREFFFYYMKDKYKFYRRLLEKTYNNEYNKFQMKNAKSHLYKKYNDLQYLDYIFATYLEHRLMIGAIAKNFVYHNNEVKDEMSFVYSIVDQEVRDLKVNKFKRQIEEKKKKQKKQQESSGILRSSQIQKELRDNINQYSKNLNQFNREEDFRDWNEQSLILQGEDGFESFLFLKDEKMLKVLEILDSTQLSKVTYPLPQEVNSLKIQQNFEMSEQKVVENNELDSNYSQSCIIKNDIYEGDLNFQDHQQMQHHMEDEFDNEEGQDKLAIEYQEDCRKEEKEKEKEKKRIEEMQRERFQELQEDFFSVHFEEYSKKIFHCLKSTEYLIYTYRKEESNTRQRFDIFEGKFRDEEIVFHIKYSFLEEDLERELEALEEVEKDEQVKILIETLMIEEDRYMFIYYKKSYDQFKDNLRRNRYKAQQVSKIKFINEVMVQKQNEKNEKYFEEFRAKQTQLIKKLGQENFYLQEYLTIGGEGLLFKGYYKYQFGSYEDVVIKIIFNTSQEEIDEQVRIMNLFERNISIIKLYETIQFSDDIFILTLENCKYSLQDELKLMVDQYKNKEKSKYQVLSDHQQQQRFERQIQFTRFKLFKIIFDLLDGLIQFRIYRIVHLDIKPQNILINLQESYVYTDFGMSSFKKHPNDEVFIKGFTQKYAPKEQQNNESKNIDFSTDIYALGQTFMNVIQIYKFLQKDQDVSYLEEIIRKHMLNEDQKMRKDCMTLHQLFYEYFKKDASNFSLMQYSYQLNKIDQQEQYDHNIDISFFEECLLYYAKINLDIQENYLRSPLKFINDTLIRLANLSKSLGDYENTLAYLLQCLEIEPLVYDDDSLEVARSHHNIADTFEILGDSQLALKHHSISQIMLIKIYKGLNHFHIAEAEKRQALIFQKNSDYDVAHKLHTQSHQTLTKKMRAEVSKCSSNSVLGMNMTEFSQQASINIMDMKPTNKIIYLQDDLTTAQSLINLAIINKILLQYESAQKNHEESKELSTRYLNTDLMENTAVALLSLGASFNEFGDNQYALKCQLQSLTVLSNYHKGDHPEIATAKYKLGITYSDLGEYPIAFNYFQESLEMRRKICKRDHKDIADCLNKLATSYLSLGQLQNALRYNLQSLQMRLNIFKGDHIDIATSLGNLGIIYFHLCDSKNAITYYLKSLNMIRKVFKEDHPEVLTSLYNLSSIFKYYGDNENALKYLYQFFEFQRKFYLRVFPHLSDSLKNGFVDTDNSVEHNQIFLQLHLQTLEMRKKVFKKDHPDIAISLHDLATSCAMVGEYKKALQYFDESLKMRRKLYKGDHLHISNSLNSIAVILITSSNFKNALKYNFESLEIRRKFFKGNHPQVTDSLDRIALTFHTSRQFESASKYYLQSLEMKRVMYKGYDNHPEILSSLKNLAHTQSRLGNHQNALKYISQYLEISRQNQKGDNAIIAQSLFDLAMIHHSLRNIKNAIKFCLQSLEMYRKIFNGDHYYISRSLNTLAFLYKDLADDQMLQYYYFEFQELHIIMQYLPMVIMIVIQWVS